MKSWSWDGFLGAFLYVPEQSGNLKSRDSTHKTLPIELYGHVLKFDYHAQWQILFDPIQIISAAQLIMLLSEGMNIWSGFIIMFNEFHLQIHNL